MGVVLRVAVVVGFKWRRPCLLAGLLGCWAARLLGYRAALNHRAAVPQQKTAAHAHVLLLLLLLLLLLMHAVEEVALL